MENEKYNEDGNHEMIKWHTKEDTRKHWIIVQDITFEDLQEIFKKLIAEIFIWENKRKFNLQETDKWSWEIIKKWRIVILKICRTEPRLLVLETGNTNIDFSIDGYPASWD